MMIKRITLVLFLSFLTLSCSTENEDLGEEVIAENLLRVPAWAKGNYDGVQTQKPLLISEDLISFEFSNVLYTYQVQDILQETIEDGRYVLITNDGTQLIFNKTTKDNEINLLYNDLNLGWFVLKPL